jgi:endonuclease-3
MRHAAGTVPSDALRRKAEAIDRLLRARYGVPRRRARRDPLSTLIATVISQHTSDVNTHRAFARLRQRFRSWDALARAPRAAVVEALRPAGLAALKAPRIQTILRRIRSERGTLSLAFLRRWRAARARAWLLDLDGVGPKTAAIVLVFGLEKPAFAVDTHVYRIGRRTGLIPAGFSAERSHDWMDALIRPGRRGPLHLLMIRHGRGICTARAPRCAVCPIRKRCDFYAARGTR